MVQVKVYRVGKNDGRVRAGTLHRKSSDTLHVTLFSLTLDTVGRLGSSTRQAANLLHFSFSTHPSLFLSLSITLCSSTWVLRLTVQCILLLADQIKGFNEPQWERIPPTHCSLHRIPRMSPNLWLGPNSVRVLLLPPLCRHASSGFIHISMLLCRYLFLSHMLHR